MPDDMKSFDPRTDVSADARHVASQIVMHLWIILVVIPTLCVIVFMLFKPH